jgi:UDP-N-acetylmuramoyl-tripeptide--D-alanyl-D-alanine ligase
VSVARGALDVVLGLALAGAFAAQMLRWLRVLQREHYSPSAMSQFLGRWSSPQVASAKTVERTKKNRPITLSHVLLVALVVTIVVRADLLVAVVTVLYGVICPVGLSIKGRTSQLHWTRRLRTIAVVATTASLVVAVAGAFTVRPWLLLVAVVWAVPAILDVTTRVLAPRERRSSQRFVDQAVARLGRVRPRIVAITGSYGKTSTKNHLADLLSADGGVVVSPRSFNNRAGLSRAINENLADGTRIFVAEMGTYGPGEIRDLCSWCPPEIAVVTAIGPVHLERMKTMEVIDQAKFEVTEKATTVVLNVDDDRLARWVERPDLSAKRVRTCGSLNAEASVRVQVVDQVWMVIVDGMALGDMPALAGVQPTNLACAIGCALELGLGVDEVMARVVRVTPVANRSNVATAPSGVVVIDDTFNANPASASAAIKLLSAMQLSGRLVVVTPGLIELGPEQYGQNMSLAQKVGAVGAELVVVGRTNVRPMQIGYEKPLRRFDTRDQAVDWVRAALVAGDGVLYLNDLPDHYP